MHPRVSRVRVAVSVNGGYSGSDFLSKASAVAYARSEACHVYGHHGIHTQLVIHKKNGQIQTEHTYGADPRRSKG